MIVAPYKTIPVLIEESNLCYYVLQDEGEIFSLETLLRVFDVMELKDDRLLLKSLRTQGVLLTIFGLSNMIQCQHFIIHILYPFRWLKKLESFVPSIQFLYNIHSMVTEIQPSRSLVQHHIINHSPFKWQVGEPSNILRFELLERGMLPRRFSGKLRSLGDYLYDACAIFMFFKILGDQVLDISECQKETIRFLSAYKIPYLKRDDEVLADLGNKHIFLFSFCFIINLRK